MKIGKQLIITSALSLLFLYTGFSFAQGRMMMDHSMQRHHSNMREGGIPEPYSSMENPLPPSEGNLKKGAEVYKTHCAICHGEEGMGDGPAGKALSPRPANLTRFLQVPMLSRDSYLMWTISDGGVKFKTAMPPFKGLIKEEDRWKLIHFIRTLTKNAKEIVR